MNTVTQSNQKTTPISNAATEIKLSLYQVGMSLGIFLALTFLICVGFDFIFPKLAMVSAWAPFFPGFTGLNFSSIVIGLVESFAYGWYIAVVFVPIYNFFSE